MTTNRIERLQNAHPFLSETNCRTLLVFSYHTNCEDVKETKTVSPSSLIQLKMEEDIKELMQTNSEDVKNCLAMAQEFVIYQK